MRTKPDVGTGKRLAKAGAAIAVALGATLVTGMPADAATSVPVHLSELTSNCSVGSFFSWKLAVDSATTTPMLYSRDTTVSVPSGSHYFVAQVWCRWGAVGGLAGRSGAQHAWVYSSGYQPRVTVYPGVYA